MLKQLAIATTLTLTPLLAQATEVPKLQIQATGTSTMVPDMAQLNLSVMRNAETAAVALRANSQAMAEILKEMEAQGIESSDLQTANFNISPIYDRRKYNGDREKEGQHILGYTVTNGLTIRVRDLSKIGTILDRAVELGVNTSGGIIFESSKADEARAQARTNAVKAAMAKAKTIADAANVQLGSIIHMSEQGSARPGMQRMAVRAFDNAESAAVPIAAGEGSYSVTVNVHWEIAP